MDPDFFSPIKSLSGSCRSAQMLQLTFAELWRLRHQSDDVRVPRGEVRQWGNPKMRRGLDTEEGASREVPKAGCRAQGFLSTAGHTNHQGSLGDRCWPGWARMGLTYLYFLESSWRCLACLSLKLTIAVSFRLGDLNCTGEAGSHCLRSWHSWPGYQMHLIWRLYCVVMLGPVIQVYPED
jgi:hypothetical protein